MRGGRNIAEGGVNAGRGASGETSASLAFAGIRTCWVFGSPWNAQQEQMPLQVSGATGCECLRMDCGDVATEKELPSHKSQCGGLIVSQSSNAQSSDAHARFLLFPLIQPTINDRGTISISAACSGARSDENEMMHPFVKAHQGGWAIDLSSFRVVESYGECGPSSWRATDPDTGKSSWP